MKIFQRLFESDYDKAVRIAGYMAKKRTPENVYFTMGREAGFEEGFKAAMEKRVRDTRELTKDEEVLLMEFLINNDIEFIYDNSINGMRARKQKFGWKDNGKTYKHNPI